MTARIATAAVLIPLVLFLVYWAPLPIFAGCLSLLLLASLRELLQLYSECRVVFIYLVLPTMPWAFAYLPEFRLEWFTVSLLLVLVAMLTRRDEIDNRHLQAGGQVLALAYLGLPFSLLVDFAPHPTAFASGHELVLLLAAVWTSDAAAYFVGRAVGRHKVVPRISPGKSAEGFAAGILVPALLLPLVGPLVLDRSVWFFLAAALLISVAGIVGDLFESLLKRSSGIKDSSNLLPGHGGLLDRVDSLLFAFPVYYLFRVLLESWVRI